MKKAFTIVELVVVIGILGVLMTIVAISSTGSIESARTVRCLSNLRALYNAANALAINNANNYPAAGTAMCAMGTSLYPFTGWIDTWCGTEDYANPMPCGGKGRWENAYVALTNGTLWRYMSGNSQAYRCPTFVKNCQQHYKVTPVWTYVMSGKFGYDYQRNGDMVFDYQSVTIGGGTSLFGEYGNVQFADRKLMFAELQDPIRTGLDVIHDGFLGDCSLQYDDGNWDGTVESIGFVHKTTSGEYCGNVIFADGHTEKFFENRNGIPLEELTKLLCVGGDYAYSASKGYEQVGLAPGADDDDDDDTTP